MAKTTKIPFVGHIVEQWLFKGDSLFFLPQDSVTHRVLIEEDIELPSEVVLPSQVVDHFIRQANVHWVMNFCICRASENCQDYPIELGCLFLGEAALGINPKLGRRVSEAEALEYVKRCREAGLIHFVGRNKLDTVKDYRLNMSLRAERSLRRGSLLASTSHYGQGGLPHSAALRSP